MASTNLARADARREERDQTHHRTVVSTAGRSLPMLIVNISPSGLMARCDQSVEPGTALMFCLPGLPPIQAEIRWALGGRLGCEFAATIPPSSYFALVPRLQA